MLLASIAFRKEKEEIMTLKLSRTQQDMHAAMVLPTCADGAGHHACSFRHKMLYGLVPRKILIIQQKAGPEE